MSDAATGIRTMLRMLGADADHKRDLRLSRLCFIAQQGRVW